jgi:predicted transcriptional regulator
MPRKNTGQKLEKVVSTKIALADFIVLEKYARIRYNENKLRQPTVSRLLRVIIKSWANGRREEEANKSGRPVSK